MTGNAGTTTAPVAPRPAAGAHGQHAAGQPGPPRPGRGPDRGWRRWRWPLAVILLMLLGAILVAELHPPAGPALPLDPRSTRPSGSRAIADLLARRGVPVVRVSTAAGAAAAARGGATLVVTSSWQLGSAQLTTLAHLSGPLVVVATDPLTLSMLAPGVTPVGGAAVQTIRPDCGLAAARLAGDADLGGLLLRPVRPGAFTCYPAPGPAGHGWALVRYTAGGRTVTVLGTGAPLTNQALARRGNAALALNLLSSRRRVVWLVPAPVAPPPAVPGQPRSLFSLLPLTTYLVTAELALAAVLAALWRMRRFGPLVAEPLPVVVRASETAEGHARLYQSRRSRDRAAATLRATALQALLPRLGLPRTAAPAAVCAELARRTGRTPGQLEALLYGPVPRDDGALVRLAADLDTLEGEVLTQ